MFESLVSTLLNRLLGDYVEGLDRGQLQVAVWQGNVELENLTIRQDALRALAVPLDITAGRIDRLKIEIPWSQLYSKPVKITLVGLFVDAVPHVVDRYDAEAEAAATSARNARELNDTENTDEGVAANEDDSGGPTEGSASLIEQIVNNLQLVIENVEVRFTDALSRPSRPIVAGLRLRSMRLVPTNSGWTPAFNSQNEQVAFRILDISDLVLFWVDEKSGDRRRSQAPNTPNPHETNLVEPITARAKLRRVNGGTAAVLTRDPRVHLAVEVSDIAMRATSGQLERIFAMQAYFAKSIARAAEHTRRFELWRWHRPVARPSRVNLGVVAAWWRYAGRAAVEAARHGVPRMAVWWDAIAKRRDTRLQFVTLWVKRRTTMHAKLDVTNKALTELEQRLSLFDIAQFRALGDAKIAADPRLAELGREVRDAHEKASQRSWSDWAGSYFAVLPQKSSTEGSKGASATSKEVVGADGDLDAVAGRGVGVYDTVATLVLASGSLVLTDSHSRVGSAQPVCRVDFVRLEMGVSAAVGLSAIECSVCLGELTLHDVVNPKTRFPYLLRKKQGRRNHAADHTSGVAHGDDSLFDATVWYTTAKSGPEFDVRVTSRPLEVVYNAVAVAKIADFWGTVGARGITDEGEAVEDPAANPTALPTPNGTAPSIFAGLSKVRLDLDLSAPEILVPEHFERTTSRLLILDLGHLRISSTGTGHDRIGAATPFSDNDDDEFLTPLSTPGEPVDDDPDGHADESGSPSPVDTLSAAAAQLAAELVDVVQPDSPPDVAEAPPPVVSFDISLTRIQVLALRADMDWKSVLQDGASKKHAIIEPLSIHCTINCFGCKLQDSECEMDDEGSSSVQSAPMVRFATVLPRLALDLSEEKIRCLLLCRGGSVAGVSTQLADDTELLDEHDQSSFMDQVVPSSETIRDIDVEVSLAITKMSVQLNAGDPVDAMPLVYVEVDGVTSSVVQCRSVQRAAFTVEAIEMTDQFLDFQGFLPQYQKMVSASGSEERAFIQMAYSRRLVPDSETDVAPHEVELHMSTLEVNVNQVTCAALLDFVHGSFEGSADSDRAPETLVACAEPSVSNEGGMIFAFHATDVQVTLLTKLRPFAVFSLTAVQAKFDSLPTYSVLTGTLGNVDITDLTAGGAMCRSCFTTNVKEEALSFSFVQHRHGGSPTAEAAASESPAPHPPTTVTIERELTLRLASARILYTQRFFSELQNYIGDFQEFQEFFHLARQTAAELIIEHHDTASVTRMDILIDRPVVIIPENSFSTYAFEANLGRMRVRNSIESAPPVQECDADDTPTTECHFGINAIKVDIDDMNLFSSSELITSVFNGPRDPRVERGMQRIVESCSVEVQWDMRLDPRRWDLPTNKATIEVSDVDIFLTKRQYGLLLCVLNENLGSEPWMKFGLHESGLSRGAETPSRLHPTDLNAGKIPSDFGKPADSRPVDDVTLIGLDAAKSDSGASHITDADAPRESRVRPEFYGSVNFTNVCLEIFFDAIAGGDPEPLARLDLINTSISYASSSDGHPDSFSSQVTWESKAIRVHDTQHMCGGVKNAFTEVLKPIVTADDASAPSLLLFTLKSAKKCATINVLLNQTRIIVALPWVVKMSDWLLQWPVTDVVTQYYVDLERGVEFRSSERLASKEEDVSDTISRPRVWKYKISITDPEFVVVENRSRPDTHAVVMKFCAVLSYRHTPSDMQMNDSFLGFQSSDPDSSKNRAHLSAVLEGLEIFSCQLQKEASTALSIVDPCNAQIEANAVFEPDGAEVTEIELHFDSPGGGVDNEAYDGGSLEMRLSYSDFQLFTSILQSLNTEKKKILSASTVADGQDEAEYVRRLDTLTHVMGYPFVDAARALSYFHGSQVRAAIWLCRNRIPVGGNAINDGDTSLAHEDLAEGESIALLMQCGYRKEDAAEALAECATDVKRALVWLLVRGSDGGSSNRLNITNISLSGVRLTADGDDFAVASERGSVDGGGSVGGATAAPDVELPVSPWAEDGVEAHNYLRKLTLRANSARLCIIDDCADNDSPLLEFKTGTVFIGGQRLFDGAQVQSDARMQGTVRCNYFNSALSAWEPCIEPWEVSLVGQVFEGRKPALHLTASALCRLELNVTSALVTSLSATLRSWTHHSSDTPAAERRKYVPYCLSNQTGASIRIRTLSTGAERGAELEVGPGNETTFDFAEVQRKFRRGAHRRVVHKITMQIAGWREVSPPLPVNRAGTFVRYVEPDAAGLDAARIVIEIRVTDGRKTIVVRGGLVVRSALDVSVQLSLVNCDGRVTVVPDLLEPRGTYYVPLAESGSRVCFSPGPTYSACNPGVQWSQVKTPTLMLLSCLPADVEPSDRPNLRRSFWCHTSLTREPFPVVAKPCAGHAITLFPPFMIESMLPCPLEFHVVGTNIGGDLSVGTKQGIYEISYKDAPQFTFKLAGFEWTEPVQLSTKMQNQATEQRLRFIDKVRRVLTLQIRIEAPSRGNGTWSLCVYASYWMVNNTGLPLSYRQAARSTTAAGQQNDIVELCSPRPLLFSCDDETLSSVNKCQVCIGNSRWSQPVAMDVVGMALTVQVDRGDASDGRPGAMVHDLGVDVKCVNPAVL